MCHHSIQCNIACSVFIALACLCGCERRAAYLSRPITIVCPWAIGGGTDAVARLMAKLLEEEIGAPVSVINRTGGGGVTGHTAGAKAPADGYTVMMITVEIAMMHHRGLTEIGPGDFAPVMLINRDAAAVFVRTDAPWKSLSELARQVREHPGKLRASGTALGGIWHLGCTSALLALGLEPDAIRWVPSEGSGPARQELLSGGIDVAFCSLSEGKPQMDSNQIRCLGVMAERRHEKFPAIPTFAEQGTNWTLEGWRGLALPKGAPAEIVRRLEEIVAKVVQGEKFKDFMSMGGYDARVESSEVFALTLARDDRVLGELLQKSRVLNGGHGAEPGPWFFPLVLSSGIAGVTLILLLKRHGARKNVALLQAAPALSIPLGSWILCGEILGANCFYLLLSEYLGFLLTAGILMLYLFHRLQARLPASLLATALLVPATYFLFAKIMRVPLPAGLIPW